MARISASGLSEVIRQGWYAFGSIFTVIALVVGAFAAGVFLSSDNQPQEVEQTADVYPDWEPDSEVEREFKAYMVYLNQPPFRWYTGFRPNFSESDHFGDCHQFPADQLSTVMDADSLREDLDPHICLHTVSDRTTAYLVKRETTEGEPSDIAPGWETSWRIHALGGWTLHDADLY